MTNSKRGFTVTEHEVGNYHTPLIIDSKDDWKTYLNMCRNATKGNRSNRFTLLSNNYPTLHIHVTDWDRALDYFLSDEFYELYRVKQIYRWVALWDVFPYVPIDGIYRHGYNWENILNLFDATDCTAYGLREYVQGYNNEKDMLPYATKVREEAIANSYSTQAETTVYNVYKLDKFTTTIDEGLSYHNIADNILSINCSCCVLGKKFIQYEVDGRDLNIMLYLLKTE